VRPGVFVPRPETEVVVEAALAAIDGLRAPVVVDVGTGTGAIALSIANERPDAHMHATDRSPAAVELANENASRLGLQVAVHEGDLLEPLPPELAGAVDLVVSNPPYVDPDEANSLPADVRADPTEALFGGTEFHRRLAADAPPWLKPDGVLVVEIGANQGLEVRAILESAGFRGRSSDTDGVEVLPDLAMRDRVVVGRSTGTRPSPE
jgi:release factor glutamine methyltransferase